MNKDWLDLDLLERYLEGNLDPRMMNRIEREALEDPFVAEALDGLIMSPKRSLNSISLLQKRLQERVAEQRHIKKASVITWQRLSVAATAAVLFISVGIIFWMKQVNYKDSPADREKKVDVAISPKVSKDSIFKSGEAIAATETVDSDRTTKAIDKAAAAVKGEAYASLRRKSLPDVTSQTPVSQYSKESVSSVFADTATKDVQTQSLNEVVVVGHGTQKRHALVGSVSVIKNDSSDLARANASLFVPVGGWPKFKDYMIKGNKYSLQVKPGQSLEYKVTIKDGRPQKVRAIAGFSRKYDREAIRLIKNGPDWQVNDTANAEATILLAY